VPKPAQAAAVGEHFDRASREELGRFLAHAKATTYAADDDSRSHRLDDGGSEARCERGAYRYRDRWYGESHFAGQELVWHDERLVWCMNFHGVTSPEATVEFFHFHKRALRRVPAELPLRGPALYRNGPFSYVNDWSGSLEAFDGVERAFEGVREIFRLEYHGGLLG
jgi:hypothetical protein